MPSSVEAVGGLKALTRARDELCDVVVSSHVGLGVNSARDIYSLYLPAVHDIFQSTHPTMPPSITPFPALRACAFRQCRPTAQWQSNVVIGVKRPACRTYADKAKDVPVTEQQGEEAVGPNMEQPPHVSEEAAQMAKITGGQGPDIEGQGTPVQDVCRGPSYLPWRGMYLHIATDSQE